MRAWFDRSNRFLEQPLNLAPRLILLVAAGLLVVAFFFPLWNLTMFAPQYPEGLRVDIYSYTLVGGSGGQDLKEINLLNHYIGMRDLANEDFTEFKWIPFVIGVVGLLFLRAAVHGKMASLVDVLVMYVYFGLFALWSFAFKLYSYGHNLAPTASVKVPPFMPPVFGYKQLANFEVYSYPGLASYALALVALLLAVATVVGWREGRSAAAATE
jgi:small-conductance mechanosensitive channel